MTDETPRMTSAVALLVEAVRAVVRTDRGAQEELAKAGHLVDSSTMAMTRMLEECLAAYEIAAAAARQVTMREMLEGAIAELDSDLARAQMIHRVRARISTALLFLDFTDLPAAGTA